MNSKKQSATYLSKSMFYFLPLLIAFWWLPFSSLFSQKSVEQESSIHTIEHLLNHTEDHYELKFGDVYIPLPVILYKQGSGWSVFSSRHLQDEQGHPQAYQGFKIQQGKIVDLVNHQRVYDFSITKNVVWMLITMLLMLLIFIGLAGYVHHRNYQPAKGYWVLPLFVIRFIHHNIARKYIGKKHSQRFTPYLLTLFFYILFNNLLGLLPEGANVTGNISITMTLAFITFFIANWNGSSRYWRHIFQPPGVPKFMYPIIVPLEILSLTLKPVILAIRLFANMLSGHLVILCIIGMIFLLKTIFAPIIMVPIVIPTVVSLGTAMILLKIFVSFIQAYVFTVFSAMSFGKAVEEH